MKTIRIFSKVLVVLGLVILPVLAAGVSAAPASWNDPNFKLVWERTDKPIEDGVTARSWMWGPTTVPGSPGSEPYVEAPGAFRTVQYFDKSRMEVNNPNGDRSQLWFVTNGLLVREMVSGKVQVGDASFTNHGSAREAVAGDPASVNVNCPSYETFKNIASLNADNPSVQKNGVVNESIKKDGTVLIASHPDPNVTYAYFEGTLKHNIPNVLWDFMNQTGPIYWNGSTQTGTVIDWVFAMGLPITEPYWTRANVGGVEKDVLVQLFERRVLTYTPSNPDGYKVEMGNVGQHYKRWRYDTPPPEERIAFVSSRAGGMQIFSMRTTGGDVRQLTNSAGVNTLPRWSPDNSKIVFQSNRDGNLEIYAMNADGTGQQRLTFDAANADAMPSWSPDGTQIVWSKGGNVYVMAANGGDVQQISNTAWPEVAPIYSPDGNSIVWAAQLPGPDYEVYKGKLDGSGTARLTFRPGRQDYPTDWHGTKMLFISWSAGLRGTWSMNDDGGSQTSIAPANDVMGSARATYSTDGSKITVGTSGEVYVANTDGTDHANITNAAGYDGQPDWSN